MTLLASVKKENQLIIRTTLERNKKRNENVQYLCFLSQGDICRPLQND